MQHVSLADCFRAVMAGQSALQQTIYSCSKLLSSLQCSKQQTGVHKVWEGKGRPTCRNLIHE